MNEKIQLLNGLTTETIIVIFEASLAVVSGLVISCYFCWPITLIVTACSPFLALGMFLVSRISWGNKGGGKSKHDKSGEADPYEKANALLSDLIINYKTVASFGEQNVELIFDKFSDLMEKPMNTNIKNAHLAGLAHGYSQCSRMLFMVIIFVSGNIMMRDYGYKPQDVYMAINVMMHAAFGIGMSMSNIPNVKRAKEAAGDIFSIIDEKSTLDVRDSKNAKFQRVEKGEIELKDVTFKYPSRNICVLNKINLHIKAT